MTKHLSSPLKFEGIFLPPLKRGPNRNPFAFVHTKSREMPFRGSIFSVGDKLLVIPIIHQKDLFTIQGMPESISFIGWKNAKKKIPFSLIF